MSEDRKDVVEELRRVREGVRRRSALDESEPRPRPDPPRVSPPPTPLPAEIPAAEAPSEPPRTEAVNERWRAQPGRPRGISGLFFRVLDRLYRPRADAQEAFNAAQVQLDNDLVRWVDERFAATHRHYDRILGLYGRHLGEADERHMILQEELVAHVADLVRRIDLALAESDRGRLALEFALEDVRARLRRLEEDLRRR